MAKGIIRNSCVKKFLFGHVIQENMSFKYISNLQLWWPVSSSAERTRHLGNFRRGLNEEQFYEITLNFDQLSRRCCYTIFLTKIFGGYLTLRSRIMWVI